MASRRSSPPHHRHDGTSPLPLGMDASPAPLKWEGPNTVWPHDPRTGWSYCVTIPSWVIIPEAKTAEGAFINPTVFYKVMVGIQSPQGVSALRGILRRFSDFMKLHAALKALFKKRLPPAPPKNSLLRTNSSHSLLQERRHALADWVNRLLEDIEISRSTPVAAFFELEAAARSAVNSISSSQEQTTSMPTGVSIQTPLPSQASWNAGRSSVTSLPSMIDYTSDVPTSGIRTPTRSTSEIEIEMDALPDELAFQERIQPVSSKGKEKDPEEQSVTSKASMDNGSKLLSDATESVAHHRKFSLDSASDASSSRDWVPGLSEAPSDSSLVLAAGVERRIEGLASFEPDFLKSVTVFLPTDQRGDVKRVLTAVQRRFEIVKADMEDLITRLQQEVAVKGFLTTKVRDLEAELDSTRRRSQDTLRQAVSTERERITELQWELEECRATLANAEESLQSEREARGKTDSRIRALEIELDSLKQQTTDLEEKADRLQKERHSIEVQAKAEKRLLAREIKTLRKSQPEIQEKLNLVLQAKAEAEAALRKEKEKQDKQRTVRASFVHEVSALRQRLQECSVDFLAKEDGKLGTITSDAMELLTTSDNRISALLAEAQLMAQEDEQPSSPGKELRNGGPAEAEEEAGPLRKLLVDILIDNAQLRKAMNSLTRSALLTVQKRDKEAMEEPIVVGRRSVLDRFL